MCKRLCGQLVAPLDVRIMPIDGRPDELMLYPLQNEMKEYEIVLAHISPIPEIFQEENGFFAGAYIFTHTHMYLSVSLHLHVLQIGHDAERIIQL